MAPLAYPLVEERRAELVNFKGNQQPIKRKGLFLNPTSSTSPLRRHSVADDPKYPHFRWWADPQPQWDQWVDKLSPKYSYIWQKAGIFDAIMASKFKLRRDTPSLLGVCRYWSKQTNTFVFPWAEATITLEDVMTLGGFSVLGEPVRVNEPVGGVIGYMVNKMEVELNNFKRKHLKGEQFQWMKRYLGRGNGDETEHIAFLSMWLSRFVLIAANEKSIRKCVFQVAVRLAIGTRIAMAPAVLAVIYRDLGKVKEYLCKKFKTPIPICAPMNIVQLWLWERFLPLRPNLKSLMSPDTPRASRWSMSGKAMDFSSAMEVLESPDEFQWRPYVDELKHEGRWYFSCETHDEDLLSFAKCLRACALVGLDCIEQYQPHRVAMQFGLDQDIPKFVPRVNDSWEAAWKTYDISSKNVKFYVSPGFFSADVTVEYSTWWRNMKKKNMKRKQAQDLSSDQMKKVQGCNETELSTSPALRPGEVHGALENSETMKKNLDLRSKVELGIEKQQKEDLRPDSVFKEGVTGAIEETNEGELHNEQAETDTLKEEKEKQLEEESQTVILNASENETMKCSLKANAVEFNHHLLVSEKPEEKCQREESNHELKRKREETEETEEKVPAKKRDLEQESEGKTEETKKKKERNLTSTKELELESIGKSEVARNKSLECESMRGMKEIEVIEETQERNLESIDKTEEMKKIEEKDQVRVRELEFESRCEANDVEVIDERDPASNKELQPGSNGTTEELTKKAVECEPMCATKEIEESDSAKKKELERDMKISRLKEEIASIQVQIRYWESVAERQSKLKKVYCAP
ncbi:uncharacterized protein A4U43_UnF11630 [Asparagus officinalis]|uniref:Aminotransferase-like plant mobile domain-containing protein n=1 Tax=Asparagus officinalis TaxID=4686 RepID=A0A1R3L587_ASPOF|nr:uncharacterized protein LOC109828248 [Asparagus officinalis]ONK54775.1 uncharacterized protein A4U43_UnF11630 [Asparagus officinalis]